MNYYINAFKNYATFQGRASRKEYWMFFLFNAIVMLLLALVHVLIFGTSGDQSTNLAQIYALMTLLPTIALGVRRLHDSDKSGWWSLLGLVPAVGGIILLVLFVLKGNEGTNKYGAPSTL